MKLLYTLFFLLGTTVLLTAQSRPDRVIYANGEIENVRLSRSNDVAMSHGITALTARGPVHLRPEDVQEVEFDNGRRYRSVRIKLENKELGGRFTYEPRFGEVLSEGAIELVKVFMKKTEFDNLALGMDNYLYLLSWDDAEMHLRQTVAKVYDRKVANPLRFRSNLKFLMRDCPQLDESIDRTRFSDGEILDLIARYAECSNIGNLSLNKRKMGSKVAFDHHARVATQLMVDPRFNQEHLALGADYRFSARFLNRVKGLGTSISAGFMYQTFRYEEQFKVDQLMARVNFGLNYRFVEMKNSAWEISTGLATYNALNSDLRSFFNNNYFLVTHGLGLVSKRFRFEVAYEHMPSSQAPRPDQLLRFAVGYQVNR